MLQQAELKQISQQIFPVIKEEIAKIAVTEIKKTLLTTDFQKTNGGYSQPLDHQLLERMVRVEEQLVAQGKGIESIITQMNKINAEQREYSDKRNAEQREYSDKRNAEQREYSDKRNAEQREYSDKRNAEQREDMNKRFEELREDMNKRFGLLQWLIVGSFGLIIVQITIFKFFLQTPTL